MSARKKPPQKVKGCEHCLYRQSEFSKDDDENEVLRCYCSARHVLVDAELMTKYCDFFERNVNYESPEKEETGL